VSGARPASREASTRPRSPVAAGPDRAAGARVALRHVEQVISSTDFDASRRSKEFLRFIADEALAGRIENVTESAIAAHVFGRGDDFDPILDPIVRIHAGCLRRSLDRYYALPGREGEVRIDLPRGTFLPVFRVQASPTTGGRRS